MTNKVILGHIDCPTCGTKAGMRITHDKNGEPFGYCEAECNQQMRIGGDRRRVKTFVTRYPWAAPEAQTVPVSVPVPAPAPEPEKKPNATKPRSAFDDALRILGAG